MLSKININKGHRQRLKDKILFSKQGQIADYELLELVLYLAIPRIDVKPLAKLLLKEFGSFEKVITADKVSLENIEGVGHSVLSAFKIINEAAIRLTKESIKKQNILSSWKALLDYCRASMGHLKIENFRVIYLNKKNVIIADDIMQSGTIDYVPVYTREIAKRALYLDCSAIILVHNHPSGDSKPSRADIDATHEIILALKLFNITVHDHVIITDKNHFSFKTNGII